MKLYNSNKAFEITYNGKPINIPNGEFELLDEDLIRFVLLTAKKWNIEVTKAKESIIEEPQITEEIIEEPKLKIKKKVVVKKVKK